MFPLRGLELIKRITKAIPLFVIEDELGTTTTDSNVYAGLPQHGQTFSHRIFLLTEKFNELNVKTVYKVHFVDETDIMSYSHVTPTELPRFSRYCETTDVSTQTDTIESGSTENETRHDSTNNDHFDQDRFDLYIVPIVVPIVIKVNDLAIKHCPENVTIDIFLQYVSRESGFVINDPSCAAFYKSSTGITYPSCFGSLLKSHRMNEITSFYQLESHPCALGPCLMNWLMSLSSFGLDRQPLLHGTLSFILKLVFEEFKSPQNSEVSEFLTTFESLLQYPYTRKILIDFMKNRPTRTLNDREFYDCVSETYFNGTWLREFYALHGTSTDIDFFQFETPQVELPTESFRRQMTRRVRPSTRSNQREQVHTIRV